ncbi:phosphotransferase [Actinomadura sp. HBU206391]|nr:phosphotransferase [Actinomadura sp. HBU206391]
MSRGGKADQQRRGRRRRRRTRTPASAARDRRANRVVGPAGRGASPGRTPARRPGHRGRHAAGRLLARWGAAAEGEALVHADLRADNLLLTPDRVVVVDWPWACVAAPWFDLLSMLPSVRLQGGPPPEALFEDHPVARGADRHDVTTALAALTGFFVWNARQPAPPGLPALRAFQAAHGEIALEWLRMRTGWE